jgi:hypothetical protein
MKTLLAKLLMLGLLTLIVVPLGACAPAHEDHGDEAATEEAAAPMDETSEEAGDEMGMDDGMADEEGEGGDDMGEGGDEMMDGEHEDHGDEGGEGESEPQM